MKTYIMIMLVALFAVFFVATGIASADIITIELSNPNAALSGFPGPYGTVTVDRTSSTTATFTFTGNTVGGFQYLFGDGGSADVNLNATSWTLSLPSTLVDDSPKNADGFGQFNVHLNNINDGFGTALATLSFDVKDTSGTWSSASNVLTPNNKGVMVAAHIFVLESGATEYTATGFASTPEPGTLVLLGSGLLGLALFGRKRFR